MKKIFSTVAIAAALFAGYYAYDVKNNNELINIALINVEALAETEGPNSGDRVSFDFNGQSWWGNPHGDYDWFPKYDDCKYDGIIGHQVYCTKGNGNCWNGTSCIKD